ncbi:OprO/OprP family phosphate-selective porin [Zavarzinia sp. CC-PAN008]|uniref:OprO/OprP family phosphate-selective porin n=1 Tax=Zavarzinia sp. CC-PAN008 TaxID=3243332 RepID=UPI003F74A280
MNRAFLLAGTALAGLLALGGVARADSVGELQRQLEQQRQQIETQRQLLQQQEQQLRSVEERLQSLQVVNRNVELKVDGIEAKGKDAPVLTVRNGRPTFTSADGQFELSIGGRIHLDYAQYFQDEGPANALVPDRRPAAAQDLNSGVNLRRLFVNLSGKLWNDFEYYIGYDLGGGSAALDEARITYTGFKPFVIDAGYIQTGGPLEDRIGSQDFLFLERSTPTNVATSIASGSTRAAVGARTFGDNYYASAYLTGPTIGVNTSTTDDQQFGGVATAAFQPVSNDVWQAHVGASVGYVFTPNSNGTLAPGSRSGITLSERPEQRVDDFRSVSTGAINADSAYHVGLEAAGQYRNFALQGEYYFYGVNEDRLNTGQSDPRFEGYYVQGSWILTGERRRYDQSRAAYQRPRPDRPFNLANGTWGAFELAARYSYIDLNDGDRPGQSCFSGLGTGGSDVGAALPNTTGCVRGGAQAVTSVALNWYPNLNLRFVLQYQHVDIDATNNTVINAAGGPLLPGTVDTGYDFHVLGLRSALTF